MMSLVRTHPDVSLNFHILDAGMSEASRERLQGMQREKLNVRLYNVRDVVQTFSEKSDAWLGFTTAIFSRFFIPELLTGEQRALYLDADVLVLRSLDKLYHSDMKGNAMLMVREMITADSGCRRLGIPRYFNSGVILFDLDRCRKLDFTNRWQEYLRSSTQRLFGDQDVINIVSQPEIGELPPCYNYLFAFHPFTHDDTAVRAANEQAAVLHFVDRNKPWLPTDTVHPFEEIYLQTMLSTPWAADVPVLRRRKMWRRIRCCLFCRMRYEDVRRGNVKTLRVLGIPMFTRCRTSVRCTFYLLGVPVFTMKYHRRSDDSFP